MAERDLAYSARDVELLVAEAVAEVLDAVYTLLMDEDATHQKKGEAAAFLTSAYEDRLVLPSAEAGDECDHNFVNPANAVVEDNGWEVCTKCGLLRPPLSAEAGDTNKCDHVEASWSGVDHVEMGDPAKVWRCDICGVTGTHDQLAGRPLRPLSAEAGEYPGSRFTTYSGDVSVSAEATEESAT